MGGFFSHVNSVLNRFVGKIIGFQSGEFRLGRGKHKFIIDLGIDPEKVWINTEECVVDGCGQIPVNKVGCTSLPGKIIFEAEIETETCLISWFATS